MAKTSTLTKAQFEAALSKARGESVRVTDAEFKAYLNASKGAPVQGPSAPTSSGIGRIGEDGFAAVKPMAMVPPVAQSKPSPVVEGPWAPSSAKIGKLSASYDPTEVDQAPSMGPYVALPASPLVKGGWSPAPVALPLTEPAKPASAGGWKGKPVQGPEAPSSPKMGKLPMPGAMDMGPAPSMGPYSKPPTSSEILNAPSNEPMFGDGKPTVADVHPARRIVMPEQDTYAAAFGHPRPREPDSNVIYESEFGDEQDGGKIRAKLDPMGAARSMAGRPRNWSGWDQNEHRFTPYLEAQGYEVRKQPKKAT